jgi:hypothetical protein
LTMPPHSHLKFCCYLRAGTGHVLCSNCNSFIKALIVLYLFQIPTDPYTGKRTSHKPQDIESVITIQCNMVQL